MTISEVGVTSSKLGSCRLSGSNRAPLYPVIAYTFFCRYGADFSFLINYILNPEDKLHPGGKKLPISNSTTSGQIAHNHPSD